MITNYIISKNWSVVTRLADTFENVVAYADKYAEQHTGDWVEVLTAERPRQKVYTRCVEEGVREVKD